MSRSSTSLVISVAECASVRAGGRTKTRKSRRTLKLPQRCVAALLFHPSEVAAGRRVVVVVSGANVSEEVLVQALKSRRPG